MSRLDLVIFGATGFTGKHAAIHMVRFAREYGLSWAVAGRSENKLKAVMAEVSQKAGEDTSGIKLIVADVKDEDSLNEMCRQCKVLVNCCGPYRFYGEPVVRAAVQNKTHYVDVCGEPQFLESMQLVYGEAARAAGVLALGACGWDSVPADMGVVYLTQHFNGVLNSVESYLSSYLPPQFAAEARARGSINYGTWESLVYGLAYSNELPALRKKLYPDRLPAFKPKLQRKLLHNRDGAWWLPFPGADESVVHRTQRARRLEPGQPRPVQMKAYFKAGGFITAILVAFGAVLIYAMSKTKFTRRLLLDYPKVFSSGLVTKESPSDDVMNNTQFTFELIGRGWAREEDVHATEPDKTLVVKVSGTNPGYGATVVALLMSAITILREKEKIPVSGGVLTPGAAFKNTEFIKNLTANNLKFEVVDAK